MKIGERIRVVKTCCLLDGCNFAKGDTGVITDIGFSTGDIIVKFTADRDNLVYMADVDEIEIIKMREVESLYFQSFEEFGKWYDNTQARITHVTPDGKETFMSVITEDNVYKVKVRKPNQYKKGRSKK